MRILITGGNGFLGSNLVDHLLKLEHELLVISRSSNNIKSFLSKIKFKKYNSENYSKYENVILDFNPEIVIHLAWEGGNNYNSINHLDQIYKNIPPGLSLLEIIGKQDTKAKFIGCGSFLEYGTIENKINENAVESPNNFYGLSKLAFKQFSQLYCGQNNINWTWIRPCYIYGSRDVKTRLIPTVINKLLIGEDITLDDCNATIDYLHVEDFCLALEKIIETNANGVFNICSGEEINLKNLINQIKEIINPEKLIFFNSELNRSLKPKYVCGSNNKLKHVTDWHPKVSLETGLLKTIDFYKHNKK